MQHYTPYLKNFRNLLFKFLMVLTFYLAVFSGWASISQAITLAGGTVSSFTTFINTLVFGSMVSIREAAILTTLVSLIGLKLVGLKWTVVFIVSISWLYLMIQYMAV